MCARFGVFGPRAFAVLTAASKPLCAFDSRINSRSDGPADNDSDQCVGSMQSITDRNRNPSIKTDLDVESDFVAQSWSPQQGGR